MSLSTDVRARLIDFPPIADLVGARVYRSLRNQGDGLPALVVTVLSDRPDYAHDGDLGLRTATVQVEAFDDDWSGADALIVHVETALHAYTGPLGDRTCTRSASQGWTDIVDEPVFADDMGTPRVAVDFEIDHHL